MEPGEETTIEIARGKTLLVKLVSVGPPDAAGKRILFFKLNGQTRNLEIHDTGANATRKENRKADLGNALQVGSPLQGLLSTVFVTEGDAVAVNQPLFVIEAMKMEKIGRASCRERVGQYV